MASSAAVQMFDGGFLQRNQRPSPPRGAWLLRGLWQVAGVEQLSERKQSFQTGSCRRHRGDGVSCSRCVCSRVCLCVHTHVFIYPCVSVCVHMYVCLSMCSFVCVQVSISVCTCVHMLVNARAGTSQDACARVCTCLCACVLYVHVCTCVLCVCSVHPLSQETAGRELAVLSFPGTLAPKLSWPLALTLGLSHPSLLGPEPSPSPPRASCWSGTAGLL